MGLATALLLLALLGGAAAARELSASTNDEKRREAEGKASSAAETGGASRFLKPPCFVPTECAPYQKCGVTNNATLCGRGYLAFPSEDLCCAPQRGAVGVWKDGCTDFTKQVSCWVAGQYFPTQTCRPSTDFGECSRNWGRWADEAACCAPGAAHTAGCTEAQPCWVADAWYPARTCGKTEDQGVCQRGWGAFASVDECCAPGAAHSQGCGAVDAAEVEQA